MEEILSIMPFSFWAVILVLVAGAIQAGRRFRDGTGLPMIIVLATVTAWYVGDAFYNDYANFHAKTFDADVLSDAWWQVAWFTLVFLLAVPFFHRWINARYLNRTSGVLQMFKHGIGQSGFQKQLVVLFYGCAAIFAILCAIAALILQDQVIYFFFPFMGYKASPWTHGRIGAGFDCFSIIAVYLQMLVAGIFGVVAALSMNRRIMWLALACCLLSWPFFIFDRTRNTMLSVVIPGLISFAFLRMRGGWIKKSIVLGVCYLLINAWMGFVIANRSNMSIDEAIEEKGFNLTDSSKVHHEGLNMFEELCWINTFIKEGKYTPNWGARYFAELVNPIPRALWPGKPLIGIDYAILRGQGGGDATAAGVFATISTGMIGQGVVNFGRLLGPFCAALLMAAWVAMLARLDLQMNELGRLPLYSLGLILTFNLGRDITLITLYPFVFGILILWWFERNRPRKRNQPGRTTDRPRPPNPNAPRPAVRQMNRERNWLKR